MSGQGGKGQKRKRPKSYYIKCAKQNTKRARHNHLEVGMKGFLVTFSSKEEICVQESLNILNEYADKMYGPELLSEEAGGNETGQGDSLDDGSDEEEEDIEKALQKEVSALKNNKSQNKRFQKLYCPAKNCLFIKSNMEEDPLDITLNILRDIAETKIPKSRYAARLLPVQATCKVFYEDILKCIENLVEPYFRCPFGTKRTYSVLFKSRNNNSISRDKLFGQVGRLLSDMNPLNETTYRNPERVILVEICNKVCCIAMVSEFFELRKFNLIEVASEREAGEKPDPLKNQPESSTKTSEDKSDDVDSMSKHKDSNESETKIEGKKNDTPSESHQAENLSKNDNSETHQSENQIENFAENKSENNLTEIKPENISADSSKEDDNTEHPKKIDIVENQKEIENEKENDNTENQKGNDCTENPKENDNTENPL